MCKRLWHLNSSNIPLTGNYIRVVESHYKLKVEASLCHFWNPAIMTLSPPDLPHYPGSVYSPAWSIQTCCVEPFPQHAPNLNHNLSSCLCGTNWPRREQLNVKDSVLNLEYHLFCCPEFVSFSRINRAALTASTLMFCSHTCGNLVIAASLIGQTGVD